MRSQPPPPAQNKKQFKIHSEVSIKKEEVTVKPPMTFAKVVPYSFVEKIKEVTDNLSDSDSPQEEDRVVLEAMLQEISKSSESLKEWSSRWSLRDPSSEMSPPSSEIYTQPPLKEFKEVSWRDEVPEKREAPLLETIKEEEEKVEKVKKKKKKKKEESKRKELKRQVQAL